LSCVAALLFGALQGFTEFLPVSSSGHLLLFWRVAQQRPEQFLPYAVAAHGGSLAALLLFMRPHIAALFERNDRCLRFVMLAVAAAPAAVVGLALEKFVAAPPGWLLALCFALSGLFCAGIRTSRRVGYTTLGVRGAFVVGLFQALALLPGVSRAGSTIYGATLLGASRKDAGVFSFLVGMVVMGGALFLELLGRSRSAGLSWTLAVAAGSSFFASLVALRLLFFILARGGLRVFCVWVLAAAAAGFVLA